MKTLMLISVILLVLGCGKSEVETSKKPVKELTKEDIVGTYGYKDEDGDTYKGVFLVNGVFEAYKDGKKYKEESKWNIVDKEVHVKNDAGVVGVFRTNSDNSLTFIGGIKDGERTDLTNKEQFTYKIIK